MSLPQTDFPRDVRAREAARLRAQGLLQREIADRMGISRSYASELLTDPDGSRAEARKRRYQGTCQDCGGPTFGGNGREQAPKVCLPCHNKRRVPEHGTASRYSGGCRCDACRAANRAKGRELRGKTPKTHGASGYVNYGCRCDVCTEGHRVYYWMRPEYRQRWEDSRRGTEPPEHGTRVAYSVYCCRCDVCRAAETGRAREYRARRKARAA